MKLFCVHNLANPETFEANPWDESLGSVPEDCCADKKARKVWEESKETRHAFYSCYESSDPRLRSSQVQNPIRFLRAIVADFDDEHSDEEINGAIKRAHTKPTVVESSPTPGHFRMVWVLDKPIAVPQGGSKIMGDFVLDLLQKNVLFRVSKIARGFDEVAVTNTGILFCRGVAWDASGPLLDHKIVQGALQEYLLKLKNLPLDRGDKSGDMGPEDAYPLLCKAFPDRFPHEWPGEFVVGSKGPAFFSKNAKSTGSTFVYPEGLMSFSANAHREHNDRFFYTWEYLLGAQAVEEFRLKRIEGFTNDIYFDGKGYTYRTSPEDEWKTGDRDLIRTEVKRRGAKAAARKGETVSELDAAMTTIHNQQRIRGACPFIGYPTGMIEYQADRYLNTWIDTRMKGLPGDHSLEWGEGFPTIARIIEFQINCPILLSEDMGLKEPTEDQMRGYHVMLSFLVDHLVGTTHFENGEPRPLPGQAVVLLGPEGVGKTLMVQEIFGAMMGGYANATKLMSGEDQFGSENHGRPVWGVDDASVSSEYMTQKLFTERTKAFVADCTARFHAKFQIPVKVDTTGCRLFIIFNSDTASLANAPLLQKGFNDKIHVYETMKEQFRLAFPRERQELAKIIKSELPTFVQFLRTLHREGVLEAEPFVSLRGKRFGTVSFHDPKAMLKIINSGFHGTWVGALRKFRDWLWSQAGEQDENYAISTDAESGRQFVELDELQFYELFKNSEVVSIKDLIGGGGRGTAYQKLRNCCNQISAVWPELVTVRNDEDDDCVYKIKIWQA